MHEGQIEGEDGACPLVLLCHARRDREWERVQLRRRVQLDEPFLAERGTYACLPAREEEEKARCGAVHLSLFVHVSFFVSTLVASFLSA